LRCTPIAFGTSSAGGTRNIHPNQGKVVLNNLNYRNLFSDPLPENIFTNREKAAIAKVADLYANVSTWSEEDSLESRLNEIVGVVSPFGEAVKTSIREALALAPKELTIEEFRTFLTTRSD